MAIHIPPDMIPRMNWNAEDKQAAWAFYRERLEQYFMIACTPKEARVTHILFYGGKEASERWTALKDQVQGNIDEADTMFKAFANSFEKSSSHWQARDEYLSDIKQDKNQTTAELDIYIKDLIRRCQFPPEDQESRKIDLLYHATAHFEVRKFVHNAKHEEIKYDRMIEVAKAHKRTCQEYQIHKQAHSMANPRILISHATVTWLGLVKVLCPNKAPRIKRQVASVSKKASEPPIASNSNSLSGSQHPPKAKSTGTVTVKVQQYELPTSKPLSHKRK